MKKMTKKMWMLPLFFAVMLLMNTAVQAQTIVGRWKTIDDETGKPKSVVELYEQNGKIYGKVIKLFREPSENQDPVCDKCSDDRKNKKIIGMVIVTGMTKDGDEWEDGEILDPKKGKLYDCEMWLEDGNLQVRGYVGPFFRTQTWYKYTDK